MEVSWNSNRRADIKAGVPAFPAKWARHLRHVKTASCLRCCYSKAKKS